MRLGMVKFLDPNTSSEELWSKNNKLLGQNKDMGIPPHNDCIITITTDYPHS